MPITISDLCAMCEPKMLVRAGQDSIDNRVKWVVSTEHLEPRDWLRGGEFMLMCGWNFRPSNTQIRRYIDHLYSCNVAGLGFGVGMKYERIPEALLSYADSLNFPVCEVPYELAFAKISRLAAEQLFDEKQGSNKIDQRFDSVIFSDALDGTIDLTDIISMLSNTFHCNAYFVSDRDGIIAKSVRDPAEKLLEIHPEMRMSRRCDSAIQLELHRDESTLTDPDKVFLSEMLFATKIVLKRNEALNMLRTKLTTDLIDELASNILSEDAIKQKLLMFGLDINRKYCALSVRSTTGNLNETSEIDLLISKSSNFHFSARREDYFEIIWSPLYPKNFNTIITDLGYLAQNCSIGVSQLVDINGLGGAILRARHLSNLSKSGLYTADSGNVNELLASLTPSMAKSFSDAVLKTSVEPQLIQEIEILLDTGYHLQETADKLGIHRHTLRAKIERFIDLTNLNIRKPRNRQHVWLALKLAKQKT